MRLESYNARKHFPLVYAWWKVRRGMSVDLEFLSPHGAVAYEGEIALAASWLYLTDSKVAQIGWGVTNPEAPMKLRHEALSALIDELALMAQRLGFKRLITFSSSRGLTKQFESKNFTKLIPHDVLVRAL